MKEPHYTKDLHSYLGNVKSQLSEAEKELKRINDAFPGDPVEDYKEALNFIDELEKKLGKHIAENVNLEQMKEYVHHKNTCDLTQTIAASVGYIAKGNKCTCGLEQLLNQSER